MAAKPEWAFELDTAGDDTYATDIVGDVIEASWQNGFTQPYQSMPFPNRATITLRNLAGKYSPEHASALAGFMRGRKLRIRATYDGPSDQTGVYSRNVTTMGTMTGITAGETAPHFDGTNDYLSLRDTAYLANRFDGQQGTISLWLKVDAGAWTDANFRYAFRFFVDTATTIQGAKLATDNSFSIERYVGGVSVNHTYSISPAGWFHIVVTWDENNNAVRYYYNGVLQATDEIITSWDGAPVDILIGAQTDTPTQTWDGGIAHVAVWGDELPLEMITALYNAAGSQQEQVYRTKPHYLLAYYPMGETSGTSAVDESTTRTMYLGKILDIRPTPGQYGDRRTTVELGGFLEDAQHEDHISVALQTEKTAGQLIYTMVQAADIYPPAYDGTNDESWASIKAGSAVYAYALDDVRETETLYSILRRLAASEGYPARMFETRAGMLRFLDRHFLVSNVTSMVTLDDTMFDMAYGYGTTIYNRVAVSYQPRRRETADAPYQLAYVPKAIQVRAGQTRTVHMRYQDATGTPISTTDPLTPGWSANTAEDESGTFLTPYWTVTATHYANESAWVVTNNAGVNGYLSEGAWQPGGDKLTDFGKQVVEHEDATSQAAYGLRSMSTEATYLSAEQAEGLAAFLLNTFKDPHGEAKSVTLKPLKDPALLEAVMLYSHDNMDRITVTETQTGHDNDHYIIGEQHDLRAGGYDYTVVWTLEPAGLFDKWGVYGEGPRSYLNGINVLGY